MEDGPAATELEEVVLDWLRQMLGLPFGFQGIINDTASISTLCAIAAAMEVVSGLDVREEGLAGRPDIPHLRLYTSEQAHSSVEKAAIILGIGRNGVRKIETDAAFRMDPHALAEGVAKDLRTGFKPFCVVATVGTTSTTSIDPVARIADLCERHSFWLHVDAAYGGAAAVIPEMRHVLDGCDRADSFVVNPHKWLFKPIDVSALYCRRPDILKRAFSLVPEYPPPGSSTLWLLQDSSTFPCDLPYPSRRVGLEQIFLDHRVSIPTFITILMCYSYF